MTLSVCCLTHDRSSTVAAMLSLFRPVADEIVVGVDSRVDPAACGPLLGVADSVLRFEYTNTPERARPWLVAQCRNDNILMVDGDEIPSQALLAALPNLVADSEALQFRIARRWCFPDERHWLAERPWWPDFQRRLVRRGPELDYDLRFHGGVRQVEPFRHVMEPLYHLACVLRPFSERRRDARRYEAERPGELAVGGGPMNLVLYGPEHFATLRPEPTPDEDVSTIRAVLSASESTPTASSPLPVVSAAEIATYIPPDPLEAHGYKAHLAIVEHDRRTDPGSDTHLLVAVTNPGPAPIPHRDSRRVQVRLCTRVLGRRPAPPDDGWVRTRLPCDVPPGETRIAEAVVRVPAQPGVYTIEADLLNEQARWFGCVTTAELTVATRWGRYAVQ